MGVGGVGGGATAQRSKIFSLKNQTKRGSPGSNLAYGAPLPPTIFHTSYMPNCSLGPLDENQSRPQKLTYMGYM